ncbi:aldehyde dehydrogenase (NADP(+)) [Microbacterium sp. AK031]|uniref:aldehyde dehydrogenase (NADP(+)) n=1 Tax=Microbacterium sp. AK031 TaxID=2723076 RepID=UPI0021671195|nr:aldehyde dehydrogenase (NADP(+)) [Microbacterium sp. AK031]MCS3843635.1 NADP-dependent aldehyde dehydrogenase [Microbacterium sp. AK031]
MTTLDELAEITAAAAAAAPAVANATADTRSGWLSAIADALDAHADELAELANSETHLGVPRLRGEVARTTGQLRLFADVITEGSYLEAVIDHADPAAVPPLPDLRRMLYPIGPIAVFSASNFPFAFSVAGGDTASALAVGCPVVVKAHSGHPALSARTAELTADALRDAGAPAGTFALVTGRETGTALVRDPHIKGVGFTGSVAGGRALYDLAVSRPDPIPFYGELGSVNPVVLTTEAVSARSSALAEELVASFTMGAGQFCTKPGVVFVPAGSDFASAVAAAAVAETGGRLLTERIAEGFAAGLGALASDPEVTVVAGDIAQFDVHSTATPVVLATTAPALVTRSETLLEECFGPTTLLVSYASDSELLTALRLVPGSLTATVHSEPGEDITELVEVLRDRAGRVLFDGWPTGVAVNWAQHHGGPWPATTSLFTSVGATAARRFQRPVAYQNAPARILPAALREENPLSIPRRVDGRLTFD